MSPEAAIEEARINGEAIPPTESRADVNRRVSSFLHELTEECLVEQPGTARHVLVVSHGGAIGCLLSHVCSMPKGGAVDNCSVTQVNVYADGGGIVCELGDRVNDTAHLIAIGVRPED